jgi:hypothetical protein
MSIGGAIVGGTAGEALMVGTGSVLAQTTNLPTSVLNSGVSADSGHFWRGDGVWANTLVSVLYTPTQLGAALRAWYEMDLLTGSAGSSQGTISDQSGNGYTLTATGTVQGTLALADLNGLNTLRFTSANSQQYQLALAILSGSVAGSMYMVYKVTGSTFQGGLDWGSSGVNNQWPYNGTGGLYYIDFGNTTRYGGFGTSVDATTSYRIISIYSATNDWAFYMDGGTGGPTGGTSPAFASTSNTVGWNTSSVYLGGSTIGGGNLDGWVAEIYFTNARQTTADRQKNEGYLAWKWGLQGNLDPSHPYKSAPPYAVSVPPPVSIGDPIGSSTPGSVLFIGGSSKLAQDNTHFYWDDSLYNLKLGTTTGPSAVLTLNTFPSIYVVPNALGNNWFEDNAGNFSVTGYRNFGTGDFALASIASGNYNVAYGPYALYSCTSGNENFAMGDGALYNLTSGSRNSTMGRSAGLNITVENDNVAIGYNCLSALAGGVGQDSNIAIGSGSFPNLVNGRHSICIGVNSSGLAVSSQYDTFIGTDIGTNWTGSTNLSRNTFIGQGAGYYSSSAQNTTIVGSWQGNSSGAVLNNFIGIAAATDLKIDWNYITANTFSFQNVQNISTPGPSPVGLHIYNTLDSQDTHVNYERGILDWNATANIFRLASQAGGTGTVRLIAIDGFQKAGAPAAGDLPSGSFALINDTSGGQTWLAYNAAGTIRKVQLV